MLQLHGGLGLGFGLVIWFYPVRHLMNGWDLKYTFSEVLPVQSDNGMHGSQSNISIARQAIARHVLRCGCVTYSRRSVKTNAQLN